MEWFFSIKGSTRKKILRKHNFDIIYLNVLSFIDFIKNLDELPLPARHLFKFTIILLIFI